MGAPCVSICSPWATTADICTPCDDYTFDALLLEDSLQIASDVLFHLSGRQFPGLCADTVRPCTKSTAIDAWPIWGSTEPSSLDGSWGTCGCTRTSGCGCSRLGGITLGGYPIVEITEVKVDGVVLDASLYRIDDYRELVRLADPDGTNPFFPCCQDLSLPDTELNTFSVSFTYGAEPPPAGVRAAAALGCQLALACQPETIGKCTLPSRVTQVNRQGVSMVLLDPFDFLENGKTGIYVVDLFLQTYNPRGLRRRSVVLSPDLMDGVRRVNT